MTCLCQRWSTCARLWICHPQCSFKFPAKMTWQESALIKRMTYVISIQRRHLQAARDSLGDQFNGGSMIFAKNSEISPFVWEIFMCHHCFSAFWRWFPIISCRFQVYLTQNQGAFKGQTKSEKSLVKLIVWWRNSHSGQIPSSFTVGDS